MKRAFKGRRFDFQFPAIRAETEQKQSKNVMLQTLVQQLLDLVLVRSHTGTCTRKMYWRYVHDEVQLPVRKAWAG